MPLIPSGMRTFALTGYDCPGCRTPERPTAASSKSPLSSDGSREMKTRSVHDPVRVARLPTLVTVNDTGTVVPEGELGLAMRVRFAPRTGQGSGRPHSGV